ISGAGAIAAGGLGGFLGFLDRKFLDYDFRLGRRNAYEFLTNEFVLPSGNDIFTGTWTDSQIRDHKRPEDHPGPGRPDFYLPIIPLMPELKNKPPADPTHSDWPRLGGIPTELPNQTQGRLDSVFSALKSDLQSRGVWPGWLAGFA